MTISNNISSNIQHDYKKGKSTQSAILKAIEIILKTLDKWENLIGILLDLTKAYDILDHKILLKKLINLN